MGRVKKEPRHYESLLERDLVASQKSDLALHFELSEQSWIAEVAVTKFNQLMDTFEQAHNIKRAKPMHLLVNYQGTFLQIPLLTSEWAHALADNRRIVLHIQKVIDKALALFKSVNPETTVKDVQRFINRRALIPRWGPGEKKRSRMPTSAKLVNPASLTVYPVLPKSTYDALIPAEIQNTMHEFLTTEAGVAPAISRSMVTFLAAKRENYCPLLSTLEPGQIVWLALSIEKEKPPFVQFGRRVVRPIRLTLYTKKEFQSPANSLEELNCIHMEQCARVQVEAYLQGTLLPQIELSLLFLRSYSSLASLSNAYMNLHHVILPTPGTILDLGTAMTHKNIIVEFSVSGLMTREIARKTYHTPESVDAYLKVFQSVLILYLYDMPVSLMARVTGRGESLIREYMVLTEKFFPNRLEIKAYLANNGLKIG